MFKRIIVLTSLLISLLTATCFAANVQWVHSTDTIRYSVDADSISYPSDHELQVIVIMQRPSDNTILIALTYINMYTHTYQIMPGLFVDSNGERHSTPKSEVKEYEPGSPIEHIINYCNQAKKGART